MLRFFNVSETEVNVSDIPAATEFQAVVYLVALNNDIYKSERLTIKSAEGGKKLKFFLYIFVRYSKPSGCLQYSCGCWKSMEISKCRTRSIYQLGNFTIRLGAIIPDTTEL